MSRPPGGVVAGRAARTRRRRNARRRLLLAWIGLPVLVLLAAVGVIGYGLYQSYRVYKQSETVLPLLKSAEASLARGVVPSGDPFGRASAVADAAETRMLHPSVFMRAAGAVPVLGRAVTAVRLGVQALHQETEAGVIIRDTASQILGSGTAVTASSGGTNSSQQNLFVHGAVNIPLLEQVAVRLHEVRAHLQAGERYVREIPSVPFVAGKIAGLKGTAAHLSSKAIATVDGALRGLSVMPSFLGADGPRTYFLALQNNADQRGTGGAVLAYALLTLDHGKFSLDGAGSILNIDPAKTGVPVPLPPAVAWYLRNTRAKPRINNGINYSPNFPMVARTWAAQVRKATGRTIDGVIALDPYGIAAMLRGQRPIEVPAYHGPIDAADVVALTENGQYRLPRTQQIALPAELVAAAFHRLTHPRDPLALARSMATALSQKRVQIWSADAGQQSLFHKLGWDGSMSTARGDYLYLVDEKRVSNKVDWYTDQRIDYTATILPSGSVRSTYHVELVNHTPPGQPTTIVGHWPTYALNAAMLNLYVPEAARFQSVTPAISPSFKVNAGFFQHVEGRFRVLTQTIDATPGAPGDLTFRYVTPNVVRTAGALRVYRLTVQHQPLAHPAILDIRLVLPAGSVVRSAPAGWTVHGNVVTFRGPQVKDLSVSVEYSSGS